MALRITGSSPESSNDNVLRIERIHRRTIDAIMNACCDLTLHVRSRCIKVMDLQLYRFSSRFDRFRTLYDLFVGFRLGGVEEAYEQLPDQVEPETDDDARF
jgi:hypothetical protein